MKTFSNTTKKQTCEIEFNDHSSIVLTADSARTIMEVYAWYHQHIASLDTQHKLSFFEVQKAFSLGSFVMEAYLTHWPDEQQGGPALGISINRDQMQTLRKAIRYRLELVEADKEMDEVEKSISINELTILLLTVLDWLVAGHHKITYSDVETENVRKIVVARDKATEVANGYLHLGESRTERSAS